MTDTIFALSSGAPPAAIAVIRISGDDAFEAVRTLAGRLPSPRRASLRKLVDPASGEQLDSALILVFPGPNTATGEDLAELHVHGGRAVVTDVLNVLSAVPGLRAAEPGEFKRRALANGRINLIEAEALGDLLQAQTANQRRAALRASDGGLAAQIERWTDETLDIAALLEAAIDHADDPEIDEDRITADVRRRTDQLVQQIERILQAPPAERLHDGLRVVLAGPPNSGKSTLFNTLVGRDAAIVSNISGTTRDVIEAAVIRNGIIWRLFDTAGLTTSTANPIERVGVHRAEALIDQAEIVIWLGDENPPSDAIHLHARADVEHRQECPRGRLRVSAATGEGVDELWTVLERRGSELLPAPTDMLLNRRQHDHARKAAAALQKANGSTDMLVAAELYRTAINAFNALTGRAGIEDMLDRLFSRFCLGK
jgi:tRNA modification GTPase